jgi:hydrogenase maturation protease
MSLGSEPTTPTTETAPRPLKKILVACIGNIFLGDDGFGVEVAQRLAGKSYPAGVKVVDFGIRGLSLAHALLEDYDHLVLVDAISRGQPPGTLYLIEPDLGGLDPEKGAAAGQVALDSHSMDPFKVLGYARTLGAKPVPTLLVGCEPAPLGDGDDSYLEMEMGLSDPVAAAVDEAVRMVEEILARLVAPGR